ncbi:MAG: PAS domain S-box protein [Magnetococcales bacterium]|nr:PAS domain S-box protein [Magnetococcales bacterium]
MANKPALKLVGLFTLLALGLSLLVGFSEGLLVPLNRSYLTWVGILLGAGIPALWLIAHTVIRPLSQLADAMDHHAIVSAANEKGLITYVNDQFVRISGYAREELLGNNHRIVKSDHHTPEFYQELWDTIASGRVWHGEVKNRTKDGRSYWVSATIVPCIGNSGRPTRYLSIRTDITRQKEMEIELRQVSHELQRNETKLRSILENTRDIIFTLRREGVISFVTPSITTLLGYDPKQLMGRHISRLLYPEDLKSFLDVLDMSAREGKSVQDQEVRFMALDDSVHWLRYAIASAPDSGRRGASLVMSASDVTRQKLHEKNVIASEEKFRTLFEATGEGVILLGKDGIMDCNEKAVELFGCCDRDDLMQHQIQDFWPVLQPGGGSSRKLAEVWRDQAFAEGSVSYEWVYRRIQDASEFPAEVLLNALAIEGQPALQIVVRDITARKEMETQIHAAKDAAEAAARAKSDFLANMSHEIRTPMNAIIGLSHLCLQTPLSTRQKDYIRKVHNSATSLLRIINDILDFSKIEAGRLDMECIDFTLEEVLGNLASMISLKAQEKHLEFLMETAVDIPPSLLGDPLRLGQILINLTNNAIKFTEQGEVAITTEIIERGEDFVRLQFTIRDSGIGMTREQIGKLFQAFSQADTSTTRKFGGTGLGLAISKRLIEMMNGSIRVESEPGSGSRFFFDVRLGIGNRSMEKTLIPTTDLRGMKVLAVDDNESARNIMADYLTSFTFKVTRAVHGKDAMVAVQEAEMVGEPFELVIMDYMMPEMDGITTIAKIRHELGVHKQPVIIMATAYGEESVVKRAMQEAEVDGFLVKPINQSLLFEAIMDAFGKSKPEGRKDVAPAGEGREFWSALSGAKILLAEDNEINQQVARELLEQANMTVVVVENGKQAVDRVRQESFDGVLMDVQMPVMDGLRAAREIRQDPQFATLPILAMTANAMSGDRDLCMEAGMQDHIAKPVDPGKMFATIARWIKPAVPKPLPLHPETKEQSSSLHVEHARPLLSSGPPNMSEGLPNVPGIDTRAGLKRMGGNVKAYLALLAKFRINQGRVGGAIRSSMANQDMPTTERLAHTLKGVAATIGAEALQRQAEILESAIKNGDTAIDMEQVLTKVEAELDRVCTTIDQSLPKTQSAGNRSVAQAGEMTDLILEQRDMLCREAARQLAFFDAAVENTLATLQGLPMSGELADRVGKIAEMVEHYDFEGAATELAQCASRLGISLDSH